MPPQDISLRGPGSVRQRSRRNAAGEEITEISEAVFCSGAAGMESLYFREADEKI